MIDDAKIVFDDMLGGSDGICNFAVLESLSDEFDDALLPFAGYRICVTLVVERNTFRIPRPVAQNIVRSDTKGREEAIDVKYELLPRGLYTSQLEPLTAVGSGELPAK